MLLEGMLWYDNDKKPLAEKIAEAAAYYRDKYGQVPNCCHIPEAESEANINDVRVVASPYILPNHLWIGVEQVENQ